MPLASVDPDALREAIDQFTQYVALIGSLQRRLDDCPYLDLRSFDYDLAHRMFYANAPMEFAMRQLRLRVGYIPARLDEIRHDVTVLHYTLQCVRGHLTTLRQQVDVIRQELAQRHLLIWRSSNKYWTAASNRSSACAQISQRSLTIPRSRQPTSLSAA